MKRFLVFEHSLRVSGHRLSYASLVAQAFPDAEVVVALPDVLLEDLRHSEFFDGNVIHHYPSKQTDSFFAYGLHSFRALRKLMVDLRPDHVLVPTADGMALIGSAIRFLPCMALPKIPIDIALMVGRKPKHGLSFPRKILNEAKWKVILSGPWRRIFLMDPMSFAELDTNPRVMLSPDPVPSVSSLDRGDSRSRLGIDREIRLIVSPGSQDVRKGADELLNGFMNANTASDIYLLMIGKFSRDVSELVESYRQHPKFKNVIQLNKFVDEATFVDAILAADLVATPYRNTARPSGVVSRAIAWGIPILGSYSGWIKWAIDQYGAGFPIRRNGPLGFERSIEYAVENLKRLEFYRDRENVLKLQHGRQLSRNVACCSGNGRITEHGVNMGNSLSEKDPANPIRVVVTYRVCQHWRAPIFSALNSRRDIDLSVFHGSSIPGTKCINGESLEGFEAREHFSIRIPFTPTWAIQPFIFFSLWRDNPDVIVAEGGSNLLTNFLVFFYAKVFRKPVVWWTLGEIRGRTFQGFFRSSYRKLVLWQEQLADVYLGYSDVALDYFLRRGFRKEQCFIAVNCVDTNQVFEQIEVRKELPRKLSESLGLTGKKVILFAGALAEGKRVDRLLRAYAGIRKVVGKSAVLIVGDGPAKESLQNLCQELSIKEDVIFAGAVVDGISDYYEVGDIFVLPVLGGLAISEAMAHGMPVVCTIADGCEVNYVINNKTGFRLFSDDDEEVDEFLKDKLTTLLCDHEKLAEMSNAASERIINRHNVNTYLDEIVNSIRFAFQKSSDK